MSSTSSAVSRIGFLAACPCMVLPSKRRRARSGCPSTWGDCVTSPWASPWHFGIPLTSVPWMTPRGLLIGTALLLFAAPLGAQASAAAAQQPAAAAPQAITHRDIDAGLSNPSRWLTYSGDYSGRRHSPLTEITPANASQLAAQWTFQTGVTEKFEASPIVVDGVLYFTGARNSAWAVDGRTGRQIWRYQRSLPPD